jgi:hypothetical protein
MKESMKKILDIKERTLYNWRKEGKPIVLLLEKYFTQSDLDEFLASGVIRRLEAEKFKNFEDPILIDHAIYSAKLKLQFKFDGSFTEAVTNKVTKVKDLLIEVLESIDSDDEYTVENSKDRLIDQIKILEAGRFKKARGELLSLQVKRYFSKAEVYAMIKYPDEVFDYMGYFAESKKPIKKI